MKKYAQYCRVSTESQTNENQKIRLLQYATDNNLSFDLYEETESSRKTRPVKQALLEKLRAGDYAGVIVFRLDRYARSSTELMLETKELIDKGIRFISVSDNLDFESASGKLHFEILCAFASFERELIRTRTIEGLARAKSQGRFGGRPKGSCDKKPRRKSGYLLRMANQRKKVDEAKGIFLSVETYLNNPPPNN
jgi:DNA invertase Pin-like site-specific DNA recombinase